MRDGGISMETIRNLEDINVRIMVLDDYDGVYDLWLNTPGMGLNNLDDSKTGIKKYLDRNPNTCFVAEKNSKIIGVIISGHDGRRGYIYHASVVSEERNKGIGGLLVENAMMSLKEEGIHKVALVAFSKTELGNSFWESHGFTSRTDLTYRNKNIVEMVRIDT